MTRWGGVMGHVDVQSHGQEHSGSGHLGAKPRPLAPAPLTRRVKTLKQSPSLSGLANPDACAELTPRQRVAHNYMVGILLCVLEGERAKWAACVI